MVQFCPTPLFSLVSDHVIPTCSQCFVTTTANQSYWNQNDTLVTPFTNKMARLDVLLGAGVFPTFGWVSKLKTWPVARIFCGGGGGGCVPQERRPNILMFE